MNTTNTIIIAITVVIIGVLAYFSADKAMGHMAVDNCSKLAATIKPGEFIQPIYTSCMNDKGFTYEK